MRVTRVAEGLYHVAHDDGVDFVYVAGPPEDRWAFWNGETFRVRNEPTPSRRAVRADAVLSLTAPMPATVLKVLAQPGTSVRKGEVVLILEAMKMELPLRAPADAQVIAVHCREGEIVQPEVVLVELN